MAPVEVVVGVPDFGILNVLFLHQIVAVSGIPPPSIGGKLVSYLEGLPRKESSDKSLVILENLELAAKIPQHPTLEKISRLPPR